MRIALTGGGTGGHEVPFGAIIEALRTLYLEQRDALPQTIEPGKLELLFLGVVGGRTRDLFAQYDVPAYNIPSGKVRRYVSHLTVLDLGFRLPIGLLIALWRLWWLMPDVIVSKGGYGSIPVVLAGRFYRIPILLHESDVTPGLATRLAARFATSIAVSFPGAESHFTAYKAKTFLTGLPVRQNLGRQDPAAAKRSFGFDPQDPVILIMGGSQGAEQLNELVLKLLPSLVVDTAIIHVAGPDKFSAVSTVAQEILEKSSHAQRYRVFDYLADDLDRAYSAADVVVARAGATTLAELAAMRKPSLLIPLASSAGDHQRKNAAIFEQAGAARVLDPNNVGINLFNRSIRELLSDRALRDSLAERLAQFDRPGAGRAVAELIMALAQGLAPAYA